MNEHLTFIKGTLNAYLNPLCYKFSDPARGVVGSRIFIAGHFSRAYILSNILRTKKRLEELGYENIKVEQVIK
jgi:hypothetical protein